MKIRDQNTTPKLRLRASRRRGMTMVELAVALTVMIIGGSTAMYGLVCVSVLARVQSENAVAFQAARNVLEAMQGEDFRTTFQRFNATPADDPVGGASPGNVFDAPGLNPRVGDPDGRVGLIEFPGGGVQLLENGVDTELGMPRDIGGILGVDGNDHALDYALLPVLVRVQWTGAGGIQQLTLAATLSNDKNIPGP